MWRRSGGIPERRSAADDRTVSVRRAWCEVTLLCLLAVSPVVRSAALLWDEWHPVGDVAAVALRAHDVISPDPPLVGMPTTLSRSLGDQAYHPGPLEFWLLAVPVELTGGGRLAPMAAVALINGVAIVAIVVLVHRAAGRAGAVAATAGVLVLLASVQGELLVDPWNPHVALLPLTAFVVALAADLSGVRWALPAAALAGSLAAQAHLASAAVVAGAALAWAVVKVTGRAERRHGRALVAAAIVLALCWAPVVVDEVTRSPGNVRTLMGAGGGEDPLGTSAGVALAVNALVPKTVWMSPRSGIDEVLDRAGVLRALLAIVVAVAAVGVGEVWRRRGQPLVQLVVVVALGALVTGAVAATRFPATNAFALHSFLWSWSIGALLWTALVGGALALWRRGTVLVVAALAVAVVVVGAAPPRVVGDRRTMASVGPLASQLRRELAPGTYLVQWGEGRLDSPRVVVGLLYAMEGSTLDLRLGREHAASVTDARTADVDEVDDLLVVLASASGPPEPPGAGARVVADHRPDAELLRDLREVEDEVLDEIGAAGGVRFESGERFTGAEARELVVSGELALYARLGVVAEPRLSTALLDRLVARQAGPVSFVRVFLEPA